MQKNVGFISSAWIFLLVLVIGIVDYDSLRCIDNSNKIAALFLSSHYKQLGQELATFSLLQVALAVYVFVEGCKEISNFVDSKRTCISLTYRV